MEILKRKAVLGPDDVSSSGIFRLIQDVSAEHCRTCGMGMETLGEKGIIWVVIRHYVKLERPLKIGETIEISTWPGETRHMMFPRYYIFRDEAGEILLRGGAIWTLVSMESRRMINPDNYGLGLEGIKTGEEIKIPAGPRRPQYSSEGSFTVPEEFLDSNKHMNNTRYYDVSEKAMGIEGASLREALTEYVSEARLGESVTLRWGQDGDYLNICGEKEGTVFKMHLQYF